MAEQNFKVWGKAGEFFKKWGKRIYFLSKHLPFWRKRSDGDS